VACAVGPTKCYHVLNGFFLPTPGFFGNLFEFSGGGREIKSFKIFKNFCITSPKHHGTKPTDGSIPPPSSRAFQRHQEQARSEGKQDLKALWWFGGSHNFKTKQTTFLHR